MLPLKGKWWKPDQSNTKGKPIDVLVHGFGQLQSSADLTHPVAIIEDLETGRLRYVELKFVQIGEGSGKEETAKA